MYDVAIIGAGSMGMAAGFYLAKENERVVLIDAFDPPHSEGSHHGETRLIRHAYGEGKSYVPMALRAQELWHELDRQVDEKLFDPTGVLNIGDKQSDFVKNVIESAKTHGLNLETLTADEVNERWEGFQLDNHLMGCYEPDSGVLMSERCIQAYRHLAFDAGAQFKFNEQIQKLETRDDEVTITLSNETIQAKKLIISAGKGTNQVLAHLNEQLPLNPTRKTFSWFQADEEFYHRDHFPGWAYDVDGQTFYGFPSIENQGVKLGRHDSGHALEDPMTLAPFGHYEDDLEDVTSQVKRIFKEPMSHDEGKVCTYTNTPDGHFIIDELPDYMNIYVACGFSGHGFKFSSVVGEILTQLTLHGRTPFNIEPFRLSRFN
ncbi:N-methyl-L-tryptophan oxidase [Alkalibacillus haloalkaliphilus]|uniref:N-methyl-L-tryptophan oxidase n=1 Tax=Alkalibacillus haloalkaliphilus TaxID=94136 RepID=UPI0002DEAFCA|nr:N-methyl-L-tryptophan oxidase [Alkalibacillus haloalkaliphilus]